MKAVKEIQKLREKGQASCGQTALSFGRGAGRILFEDGWTFVWIKSSRGTFTVEAVEQGAAVLIGGHTGALVFALRSLDEWPEMVVFETERVRDERGRFVFAPKGLLVIPARQA